MIIYRLHAKYHCFGKNGLGVTEIQRGSNILKRTIVDSLVELSHIHYYCSVESSVK